MTPPHSTSAFKDWKSYKLTSKKVHVVTNERKRAEGVCVCWGSKEVRERQSERLKAESEEWKNFRNVDTYLNRWEVNVEKYRRA